MSTDQLNKKQGVCDKNLISISLSVHCSILFI